METDLRHTHTWHGETVELAVKRAQGSDNSLPGFVWLGGFRSDMLGGKAETMVEEAALLGASSLRFDYSGHGASGGRFSDGTISRWVTESLAVIEARTEGPQILLGSSMGAWIALRVAQEMKKAGQSSRLAGLILIAPAPDFTAELMEPAFSKDEKRQLRENGLIEQPSAYSDEPDVITRDLIEDGRNNLVLTEPLAVGCPVRILQGMRDPDVPYTHALKLVDNLAQEDVVISLIKHGDHRLSEPENLTLLRRDDADAFVPGFVLRPKVARSHPALFQTCIHLAR